MSHFTNIILTYELSDKNNTKINTRMATMATTEIYIITERFIDIKGHFYVHSAAFGHLQYL